MPIRDIYKQAFAAAGLPYRNPYCFRHALARLGGRSCTTPEHFKAGSQNLGHELVLNTFTSYGSVPAGRQADPIRRMSKEEGGAGGERLTEQYLDRSYITGSTIDHRGFRSPEGVCAVFGFSQADSRHPFIDQACILPRAHMGRLIDTTWE